MDQNLRFRLFGAISTVCLLLGLGAVSFAADSDEAALLTYDPRTIPANAAELSRHLIEAGVDSAIVGVVVETDPLGALDVYAEALGRFGPYIRGDTNGDGDVDVSDAIHLAHALFLLDETVDCEESADVNGDRNVDISDVIGLFQFLFLRGSTPGAPFPNCGTDGGTAALTCNGHGFCPSAWVLIQVCKQSARSGAIACRSLGPPYSMACELSWAVQAARCMKSAAQPR